MKKTAGGNGDSAGVIKTEEDAYTVELRALCTEYDRPYVAKIAQGKSAEQQERYRFLFKGPSQGDVISEQIVFEDVKDSITTAESLAIMFKRLRRFVVPPLWLMPMWENAVDVSGEDLKLPLKNNPILKDPMNGLPKPLLNELNIAVQNHLWSNHHIVKGALESGEEDAERGAPLS